MRALSIDTETLGRSPTATILQVGIVVFDDATGEIFEEHDFYPPFGKRPLEVDSDTINWWCTEHLDVFTQIWDKRNKNTLSFAEIQKRIFDLLDQNRRWWFNHPSFDWPKLDHTFKLSSMFPPDFNVHRPIYDVATLSQVLGVQRPARSAQQTYHNALADARYQAEWVAQCVDKYRRI